MKYSCMATLHKLCSNHVAAASTCRCRGCREMCVSMLPTRCPSLAKVHRKGSSKIWGHRAISDFRYALLEGRLSLQGPAANNPLWPMTSGYMSSLRDVAEKERKKEEIAIAHLRRDLLPNTAPTVYGPRLLILLRTENSTSNMGLTLSKTRETSQIPSPMAKQTQGTESRPNNCILGLRLPGTPDSTESDLNDAVQESEAHSLAFSLAAVTEGPDLSLASFSFFFFALALPSLDDMDLTALLPAAAASSGVAIAAAAPRPSVSSILYAGHTGRGLGIAIAAAVPRPARYAAHANTN